tara:strand:+ start:8340 stop:8549 length:210 start_codon:yes stop_codon:yes gene_type:complete
MSELFGQKVQPGAVSDDSWYGVTFRTTGSFAGLKMMGEFQNSGPLRETATVIPLTVPVVNCRVNIAGDD